MQSKEGLALINGTQFMAAHGLFSLIISERLIAWADVIAAISFEAFDGVKEALLNLVKAGKSKNFNEIDENLLSQEMKILRNNLKKLLKNSPIFRQHSCFILNYLRNRTIFILTAS